MGSSKASTNMRSTGTHIIWWSMKKVTLQIIKPCDSHTSSVLAKSSQSPHLFADRPDQLWALQKPLLFPAIGYMYIQMRWYVTHSFLQVALLPLLCFHEMEGLFAYHLTLLNEPTDESGKWIRALNATTYQDWLQQMHCHVCHLTYALRRKERLEGRSALDNKSVHPLPPSSLSRERQWGVRSPFSRSHYGSC